MILKQDQTAIVFLGSFNPRIVHPAWMERYEVLTSKEAEDALSERKIKGNEATEDDSSTKLIVSEKVAQVIIGALEITVQSDRLMVVANTQDRHQRSFEITVALQKLLPHSPARAMGLNRNFVLELENEAMWHKVGHTIIPKDGFWKENGDEPRTTQAAVRYQTSAIERAQLNLLIGPEGKSPLVRVNCNYNFDASAVRDVAAGESLPIDGLRLADFGPFLTEKNWNVMCSDAFEIVERVDNLGKA